jgi:protein-S-isoprenylcysteine O-methyltransferase Ste14
MRDVETLCRIALALTILGAAAIGLPFRIRADRAGGAVSVAADPRWFWVLMLVVGPPAALGCLGFLIEPRWLDRVALPLPAIVRLLGIAFAAAGLALFAWMFRHLGLNVTSTSMPRAHATLVTSGPYRWIRHPMYSAALLLAIAATLFTASLPVLLGGLAMFVLLAARSGIEERRLVEKFGDAYRTYQSRTGRFVPRPRPRA